MNGAAWTKRGLVITWKTNGSPKISFYCQIVSAQEDSGGRAVVPEREIYFTLKEGHPDVRHST